MGTAFLLLAAYFHGQLLMPSPLRFEDFYQESDNSEHIVLRCPAGTLPFMVYWPENLGPRVGDGYDDARVVMKCVIK